MIRKSPTTEGDTQRAQQALEALRRGREPSDPGTPVSPPTPGQSNRPLVTPQGTGVVPPPSTPEPRESEWAIRLRSCIASGFMGFCMGAFSVIAWNNLMARHDSDLSTLFVFLGSVPGFLVMVPLRAWFRDLWQPKEMPYALPGLIVFSGTALAAAHNLPDAITSGNSYLGGHILVAWLAAIVMAVINMPKKSSTPPPPPPPDRLPPWPPRWRELGEGERYYCNHCQKEIPRNTPNTVAQCPGSCTLTYCRQCMLDRRDICPNDRTVKPVIPELPPLPPWRGKEWRAPSIQICSVCNVDYTGNTRNTVRQCPGPDAEHYCRQCVLDNKEKPDKPDCCPECSYPDDY